MNKKPSFWLSKSCTPLNEYGWQQSLSLLNYGYFWIVTSASGKVNTMSHNRVISNWMLLCFGFALLRNMIGVELKHTPYLNQPHWKLNPIAILVTCVFSRLGQITCFAPPPDYTPLTFLWFWFYNTQLKCPLKENLVHWAYLKNRINVKPLNCSSFRFWFNIVLSSLQRVLFIKWLSVFPVMTDTPSSACSNTWLLLQLLGYLRKSTCRFSFYLGWRLII